jgi:hypothetical protein
MPNIGKQIVAKAIEILDRNPNGVRYADLVSQVEQSDDSFEHNFVVGQVVALPQEHTDQVYKPSRGLYRLTKYRDEDTGELKAELVPAGPARICENDFYQPFAEWLVNETGECTKAVRLGGHRFGGRYGTPDVVGKFQSKRGDIVPVLEIVSAEIKLDSQQLVTAFGQACAYLLFSHRVYLVIPQTAPEEHIDRIDSLCRLLGIGLVLFDPADPRHPKFDIRCRPTYHYPDPYYTNEHMRKMEDDLFS